MAGYRRGRSELTVGFFAFGSIAVFALMFGSLTSRGVIRHNADLYVVLPSADGLLKGDAVLYRGVRVGEVKEIGFHERVGGGVVVRAKLNRELPLTSDALAVLTPADMFGRQSMVLRDGAGTGRPLGDSDTLAGDRPRPLADRVDGLGRQVERFLGDSTLALLHGALAGAGGAGAGVSELSAEATRFLAAQQQGLAEVSAAAGVVARNLSAVTDSAELIALRGDLRAVLERLASASARMDSASILIASVFGKIDQGEGSLSLLLNDDELHERVTGAVGELELLLADVRAHPARYLTVEVF